MGLITVSGQAGCRYQEVARLAAQKLGFELITESQIAAAIEKEFGVGAAIPERAWPDVVASILAHLAAGSHLVVAVDGAELVFNNFPGLLRIQVMAPESSRVGQLMVDLRLERAPARQQLREQERRLRQRRMRRFRRATSPPETFDLICNAASLDSAQMADLIESAARSSGLIERGPLSAAAEAQLQFQFRLRLAKHGIAPPGKVDLPHKSFAHPSEQIFANLLDFYRIPWEYEPRSFAVQWDKDGKVLEAFTPDFYLPEMDLYIELTTMKQAHVTKKNRKVKLLHELYPHVNIQVFYQKDFENLIFKYGLAEKLAPA
jgi:cytidylate kinase